MKTKFILSVVLLLVAYSSQAVVNMQLKDKDITSEFTCPIFKQELKNKKIIADTACIMRSEVAEVTRLQIDIQYSDQRLRSLAGLEYFENLRELSLKKNK